MKKQQKIMICRLMKNFFRKCKKSLDFLLYLQYNLNVRRINACGGANLEKRTTKVKKPEIALS